MNDWQWVPRTSSGARCQWFLKYLFLLFFCLIYTICLVIPFCTFQSQSRLGGCICFSSWAKCYLPWYRCAEMTCCEQKEVHQQPQRKFYAIPRCQATYLTWMLAARWYTFCQFHEIAWLLGKVLLLDSSQTAMVILTRNTKHTTIVYNILQLYYNYNCTTIRNTKHTTIVYNILQLYYNCIQHTTTVLQLVQ